MNLFEFFNELLLNPNLANYIIAMQIPIVLCLCIQSYQTYKLGFKKETLEFKEFKLISVAWVFNFLYLILTYLVLSINVNSNLLFITRIFIDLLSTCFFLSAIKGFFDKKPFDYLKKIPISYFYIAAFIFGILKIIPESKNHFLPFVDLQYIPVAVFNFSVLYLLSRYFKKIAKKFHQNQMLGIVTTFYAFIQFLAIVRIDDYSFNHLVFINIFFVTGLFLKIAMLIFLSILMINVVNISSSEQRGALLEGFSKATNKISDIEPTISKTSQNREDLVLELVLKEILQLLNKDLGYYSSYNEKKKMLQIRFASTSYKYKVDEEFSYSDDKGLTGKAVTMKGLQVMKKLTERNEYKKFASFGDKKNLDKNVNSAIAIPLLIDTKVLGVFMIESDQENSFSELDISIVTALISQAKVAIKNNRLIHDIEISKDFLESLKKIDKQILYNHDNLEPALSLILHSALQIVKSEAGNIDIVSGDKLVCIASTNIDNINASSSISESLSGLAVIEKTVKYFKDITNLDGELLNLYSRRLGKDYKCELIVPLIVNNEVLGIFNTESKEIDYFTKDDIEKIERFAEQAAIAIYITKLIEDINAKNAALENSIDKRNIEMTFLLGNLINHRIGNEIGLIRTIIKDELLFSQRDKADISKYGELNNSVIKELEIMLESSEKVLRTRNEVSEKINELLTFNPTRINFIEIKSRIETTFALKLNHNIRIEIIGFENLKPIYVSSNLMMEVIFEIINNAKKSMPNGGNLLIKGRTDSNYNIISFKDNGRGILSNDISKIFQKGFTKWANNTQGGGIGLAEVKKIIDFWKGKIEVESKIDSGTTFTIKIPFTN